MTIKGLKEMFGSRLILAWKSVNKTASQAAFGTICFP